VQQSAAGVDGYLLHAVRGRAGAMRHCASMRRLLLADAGDFVAALLDAIAPELDGKASDGHSQLCCALASDDHLSMLVR
jgi:hypothetical protein